MYLPEWVLWRIEFLNVEGANEHRLPVIHTASNVRLLLTAEMNDNSGTPD